MKRYAVRVVLFLAFWAFTCWVVAPLAPRAQHAAYELCKAVHFVGPFGECR